MKDIALTLWEFWNSFGIPAYAFNQMPDNAELPYILYNIKQADTLTDAYDYINIFYSGKNSLAILQIVDDIRKTIGTGKALKVADRGYLHINEISFQALPSESEKVDVIGYNGQFLINYNLI